MSEQNEQSESQPAPHRAGQEGSRPESAVDPHKTPPPTVYAPAAESPRHENTDVNVPSLVYFAIGLVVFVVLMCLGIWGMMKMFMYHTLHGDLDSGRQQSPVALNEHPPDPVLQPTIDIHPTKPWQDVKLMNEHNERVLGGYGWVDRRQQVARIPLENAVDFLVAHGLPAVLPATEPSTQPAPPTTSLSPTVPPLIPNAMPTTTGGSP